MRRRTCEGGTDVQGEGRQSRTYRLIASPKTRRSRDDSDARTGPSARGSLRNDTPHIDCFSDRGDDSKTINTCDFSRFAFRLGLPCTERRGGEAIHMLKREHAYVTKSTILKKLFYENKNDFRVPTPLSLSLFSPNSKCSRWIVPHHKAGTSASSVFRRLIVGGYRCQAVSFKKFIPEQ